MHRQRTTAAHAISTSLDTALALAEPRRRNCRERCRRVGLALWLGLCHGRLDGELVRYAQPCAPNVDLAELVVAQREEWRHQHTRAAARDGEEDVDERLSPTRADTGHDVEAVGERIERVTLTRVQIEGQQLDQLVELCSATLVQTAPWSHAA